MKRKEKSASKVSNLDVLETISDQLSINIITAISNKVTNSDHLMQVLKIGYKEYYSRSSRLARLGLIGRKNGEIILTSFGRVVYNAQLKIANAFSYSSELTMIDAMRSHSGMPEDQQKEIIDKIIKDSELKKLVAATNL